MGFECLVNKTICPYPRRGTRKCTYLQKDRKSLPSAGLIAARALGEASNAVRRLHNVATDPGPILLEEGSTAGVEGGTGVAKE